MSGAIWPETLYGTRTARVARWCWALLLLAGGVALQFHANQVATHPFIVDPNSNMPKPPEILTGPIDPNAYSNPAANHVIDIILFAAVMWAMSAWNFAYLRFGPKPDRKQAQ